MSDQETRTERRIDLERVSGFRKLIRLVAYRLLDICGEKLEPVTCPRCANANTRKIDMECDWCDYRWMVKRGDLLTNGDQVETWRNG